MNIFPSHQEAVRWGAMHRTSWSIVTLAALLLTVTALQAAHSPKTAAVIPLAVPWKQARVTPIVPAFASGREIKGSDLATLFSGKTVDAADGVVSVPIGSVPVVIESAKTPADPDGFTGLSAGSPLGIHGIENNFPENLALLQDSGFPWVHLAGPSGLVWDLVEPSPGVYNWEHQDRLFRTFQQMGVKVCVVVLAANRWDQGIAGPQRPKSRAPVHMEAYKKFLRAAVKRYSSVVACWQIENEIDNPMSWEDTQPAYLALLSASYAVIKENAPDALVAFAGMSNPRSCKTVLLPMLKTYRKDNPQGTCFDIVDLHWSRQFQGTYGALRIGDKSHRLDETLRDLRENLDALSFKKTPIWIAEMSDYTGKPAADPIDGSYEEKSETEQAASLAKMSVLALANGASRTFWIGLVDWYGWGGRGGGYFDHVGLAYNRMADPQGTKKMAYYSGKFLSHKLDGCTFETAVPVSGSANVRVYKFLRNGDAVYVAWRDPS